MTDLLGINDITKLLGIGRNTAYKLINSGELPSIRLGRKLRVRLSDINEYINDKFDSQKKKK